tara:strand:- start:25 stop:354 length:330 start_codon:yes stop_codon:yes gene_type:complete
MNKKPCVNCGKYFFYYSPNKKFCSDNCRFNYNDRRKKVYAETGSSKTRYDAALGITLPYIPDRLIVKEIDWEEQRLIQKKHLIQGDEERKKALEINFVEEMKRENYDPS